MSKNLIPQIAQMLGVEIGEKFKITGYNEPTYRFDADGLKASFDNFSKKEEGLANASLGSLLAGKLEIIKLPWKPNVGEEYYTFSTSAGKWIACRQRWTNHPIDLALLDKGWVFHSKKGAEDALLKVASKFGVKYEI